MQIERAAAAIACLDDEDEMRYNVIGPCEFRAATNMLVQPVFVRRDVYTPVCLRRPALGSPRGRDMVVYGFTSGICSGETGRESGSESGGVGGYSCSTVVSQGSAI